MKNIIQVLVSVGIMALIWNSCTALKQFDMQAFSQSKAISITFGVLFAIEAIFMIWWLVSEMGYQYLSVNPMVYVGWLWLIVALLLFVADFKVIALIMVSITALPLALMGLYMLIILLVSIFDGPIRWN